MNILNKKDMSQAPVFGGVSILKSEKQGWRPVGPTGVFEMISKYKLNIEGIYQRDAASNSKILSMARDFDWSLFCCVTVALRNDGTYWVLDGGHRVRSSFYREEVDKIPCMVFKMEDISEEAAAFLGINTTSTAVHSFVKFRAGLASGDEVAIAAKRIISKHGYVEMKCSTGTPNGFVAVGSLMKLVKVDSDLADRVFGLCVEIAAAGENIPGILISGIFTCARKIGNAGDFFCNKNREKLIRRGIPGLMQDIATMSVRLGKGGEVVAALAVLDRINFGCRTKRLVFCD